METKYSGCLLHYFFLPFVSYRWCSDLLFGSLFLSLARRIRGRIARWRWPVAHSGARSSCYGSSRCICHTAGEGIRPLPDHLWNFFLFWKRLNERFLHQNRAPLEPISIFTTWQSLKVSSEWSHWWPPGVDFFWNESNHCLPRVIIIIDSRGRSCAGRREGHRVENGSRHADWWILTARAGAGAVAEYRK